MTEPFEPAPTGKPSGIPAETRLAEEPRNPFEALRTRTLIPWMILGGALLFAALLLASLVTPLNTDDPATGQVAFMLSGYGVLLAWIVWACRSSGIGLRRLVGRLPARHNWLATLSLLAVTMAFSIGSWQVFARGLALAAPGVLEFLLEALEGVPDPPLAYKVAMVIVVAILAPVVEEVLFRGILLNRWAVKWGVGTSVAATSIAFGLLHGNPVGITMVGLVAAVLYLRTGSLVVPIAFHAANNLVATIPEFVMGPMEPMDVAAEIEEIREAGLWGVAVVTGTLPVLAWYVRRYWPGRGAEIPYPAKDRRAAGPGIAEIP